MTRVELFFIPAGGNALDIVPGAVERQGGTLELIVDAIFGKKQRNKMKGSKELRRGKTRGTAGRVKFLILLLGWYWVWDERKDDERLFSR